MLIEQHCTKYIRDNIKIIFTQISVHSSILLLYLMVGIVCSQWYFTIVTLTLLQLAIWHVLSFTLNSVTTFSFFTVPFLVWPLFLQEHVGDIPKDCLIMKINFWTWTDQWSMAFNARSEQNVYQMKATVAIHPYHLQCASTYYGQPGDYGQRVEICRWTFTRDQINTMHNHHVWSLENPQAISQCLG